MSATHVMSLIAAWSGIVLVAVLLGHGPVVTGLGALFGLAVGHLIGRAVWGPL